MAFHVDDGSSEGLLEKDCHIRRRKQSAFPNRLLIASVALAQVLIVGLTFGLASIIMKPSKGTFPGNDINGIVPEFSTSQVIFDFATEPWVPGPKDENVTDRIFDNWTNMLPVGNGVMNITNWQDYPYLTPPITLNSPRSESSTYSTAWVHQLHCLFFVMKEYHRVLHHGPDGTEYYIDPTHNSYHASHCFNYLRQAILCSLDSTLEGSGNGSGAPDGSGQTHICRNRNESIAWLESRRADSVHAIDNTP